MKRRAPRRKPVDPDDAARLRRRAEARLRGRARRGAAQRTSAESARLLHELEVHQIELSMQNAELRAARDELETLLERYTDLYDSAPVGHFSVDETGRILEANLTGAAMVGVDRSRLVDRDLQTFVAAESRPTFQAFLDRVFQQPGKQVCEALLRGEGGAAVWTDVQAASAASLRGARRWCRVAVSDISALKRAAETQLRADALAVRNMELQSEIARRQLVEQALNESDKRRTRLLEQSRRMQEQLRQLSHGILHAQEEERTRISRELHDEIAQSAVAINVHLQMLSRDVVGRSAARNKRVAQTKRLLEEFVEVVHHFSRQLRPTTLDDLGLVPALSSFTKDFARRAGIDVRFESVPAAEQLTDERRTALYRVAQEALSNVAKHARAGRAVVRLREAPGGVLLEVADDGQAFPVEQVLSAKKRRSLGLLGMRERVEMVGGKFSIKSTRGTGTRVRAVVPLEADARPT